MTTPNENFQRDDTNERVEVLRDDVLETREDFRDDYLERQADYRDDDEEVRREDQGYYERYGYDDDEELDQGSGFHSGSGMGL